jgi:hypothetical protein
MKELEDELCPMIEEKVGEGATAKLRKTWVWQDTFNKLTGFGIVVKREQQDEAVTLLGKRERVQGGAEDN